MSWTTTTKVRYRGHQKVDVVESLLEYHADINLPDKYRRTAFWLASSEGELEVALA